MRQRPFRAGLVLPLAQLALFLTSMPASAHDTPPSVHDDVIASIREQAESHARYGDCTEAVTRMFRDNPAGLTEQQIASIYTKEYARVQKELERGGLKKNFGWFLSSLLTVWIIFQSVLKDGLTRFFTAAFAWSGRQLFLSRALKHYQRTLRARLVQTSIAPSLNRPLGYVPLKVQLAGTTHSHQAEACGLLNKHPRSMIKGAPGSGKSMLLKQLALSCLDGLFGRRVPVLLALHRFNDPTMKLEDLVVDELARNAFSRASRFVSSALENGGLLLLLDGLDEVNSSQRRRVVQHLRDSLNRYSQCRAVITCRTAIYRGEFEDIVDHKTFELVGFDDQQIRLFLSYWAEGINTPGKSIEQLIQTLHDRPRLMALARSPLLLTIIAYLYTDTAFVLPNSRTDFYRKATDILLGNECHKEFKYVAKATDRRVVLQHLALHIQDATFRQGQDRLSMERPEILEHVRKVLRKLNLKPENADAVLEEIVERSGLLLEVDGGERYQFAHPTLQEYFAATALRNDAQGLLERFEADPDAWRETVRLWCGLDQESTELIRAINEKDPLTAFECLADAQEVQPALANELLENFKARLGRTGVDDAVVKAFGTVASDMRPRGEAIFNLLKELLRTAEDPMIRTAAANALALTNLPSAAHVLAGYHARQPDIRAALVRMGDLAIPALKPLIDTRPAETMDDLLAIGTPLAAQTLVPWLWHSHEDFSMRAAWRMAALLPRVGVKELLREHPLMPEQKKAGCVRWVWEAFQEPEYSSLPTIAGRVAFLLARAPVELAPTTPQALEPHLIIPVCAILRRSELVRVPSSPGVQTHRVDPWDFPTIELALVVQELLRRFNATPAWRLLLRGLPLEVQAELLLRLDGNRCPTEQDWRTAFLPAGDGFEGNWWYYRSVVAIALVFSGVAMLRFIPWPKPIPTGVLLLFWGLLLAVGLVLWTLWRQRDRKSHNPLQNIIAPPSEGPVTAPPTPNAAAGTARGGAAGAPRAGGRARIRRWAQA
jgi:hypothetical protein